MSPRIGIGLDSAVEAAAVIADRDGLETVTLAGVAAELGIKAPSLYNYFDGVRGLRRQLTLLGLKLLGDTVSRACMGLAGDEAVMATADAVRTLAVTRPGVYLATVHSAAPEDPELMAAGERVIEIFRAVLRGYRLEGDEAVHAVRVLRTTIHGFVLAESAQGFRDSRSVDKSFARLVAILVLGLNSWPQIMEGNRV